MCHVMTASQDSPSLVHKEQHPHSTIEAHDCSLHDRNTFAVERKTAILRQMEYYGWAN